MKCPKCGTQMRPSKKYPGSYLCDHCRKRYPGSQVPKSKTKNRQKGFIFIFFLLLVVAIVFSIQHLPFKSSSSKEDKVYTYDVTKTALYNGLEFSITSIDTVPYTDANAFLRVNATLKNTTDKSISINGISAFQIYSDGTKLPYSSYAYKILTEEKPALTGNIEAESSISGFLCFEVPSDWSSLDLQFSNPVWASEKIIFKLTNE